VVILQVILFESYYVNIIIKGEVIPQRASRFFNFDQNSPTNLPLSSYSVLGNKELSSPVSQEKNVSLENENKFIRRRILHRATFNANVPSYKIDSPSNKLINSQSQYYLIVIHLMLKATKSNNSRRSF